MPTPDPNADLLELAAQTIAQYGRFELPDPPASKIPAGWDQILAVSTSGGNPWWVHSVKNRHALVFDQGVHRRLIDFALTGELVQLTYARAMTSNTQYIVDVRTK